MVQIEPTDPQPDQLLDEQVQRTEQQMAAQQAAIRQAQAAREAQPAPPVVLPAAG